LLLGANAAVLVLPLLALAGLRLYDAYLLRQTERQLIAEAAVVGEVFREAYARETGKPPGDHRLVRTPASGTDPAAEPYQPIEPILDFGHEVLPPQASALRPAPPGDTPARRAGAAIVPLLRRAQTFNLSAVRVLDRNGCVVATTRSEAGLCLDALPEVQRALTGRYAAVARERISDEPPPPFGDLRRRGTERVFIALPVMADGELIAVVRASRTGLDALSSLWANRRGFVLSLALLSLLSLGVSAAFSAAIAAPLRRLTLAARSVAAGGGGGHLGTSGFAPAEIALLGDVLQTMTDQLQQRARYIAEFASNASHELKTPITAIRGAAELLQQEAGAMDEAQRARFLANIVEDAQRMERLVTRMLELARIENAPAEAATELELRPLLERIVERHPAGAALEWHGAPARLAIAESHLHGVVLNLLDNALRHGGGRGVKLRASSEDGRLRIEVSDAGPGISEANQKRLFQRFFTTARDQGGTGLGLAIVKATALARGGRVAVQSSSEGTTFTIVL
jgi:signal transduction histidine kinase